MVLRALRMDVPVCPGAFPREVRADRVDERKDSTVLRRNRLNDRAKSDQALRQVVRIRSRNRLMCKSSAKGETGPGLDKRIFPRKIYPKGLVCRVLMVIGVGRSVGLASAEFPPYQGKVVPGSIDRELTGGHRSSRDFPSLPDQGSSGRRIRSTDKFLAECPLTGSSPQL